MASDGHCSVCALELGSPSCKKCKYYTDEKFWNKVAEELKPTIKRALEETFEPTKCMNEFYKEEING